MTVGFGARAKGLQVEGERIDDALMQKSVLGSLEIGDVGGLIGVNDMVFGMVGKRAEEITDVASMLSNQRVRFLDADTGQGRQIIAARQHASTSEHRRREVNKAGLDCPAEVRHVDELAIACVIHLEEDTRAAKRQEIRVLGDDNVNVVVGCKIGELCISFIRCDDKPDTCGRSWALKGRRCYGKYRWGGGSYCWC